MTHPLLSLEPRLRYLLPATLYATMWVNPNPEHLQAVFEHLRTLHRNLCDYVPNPIQKGWQEGTLMFSDLAGFTQLSEANAAQGQAVRLGQILNTYFTTMLDIAANFGGEVLEFAGDSLLVQFRSTRRRDDSVRAAQAGLLMQEAMASFQAIQVGDQGYPLAMRIGIHRGRYLSTVLGSPRRQQRVILGALGQVTKQAESVGEVGRVCITEAIASQLPASLAYMPHREQHYLLAPTVASLPDYAPTLSSRPGNLILLDRSEAGLLEAISKALDSIEPLASFLPQPILELLVENAREIPPDFPLASVLFINVCNLEVTEHNASTEPINTLSLLFIIINAIIESAGGIIQKVVCHTVGSSVLAYFGVLKGYTNDAERAVTTALAIREATAGIQSAQLRMGLARGAVFAAEVGERRGRREFNILGDTVNTAARLMDFAQAGHIVLTEAVVIASGQAHSPLALGLCQLKGKTAPLPLFRL